MVRSNDKHKIGSLLIKNRLCVAISRAKYGFFAIGNFESIKKNRQCKEINIILIQWLSDFDQRVDGGCTLKCGHKCNLKCHANKDPNHVKIKCEQICIREKLCKHSCNKICSSVQICDLICEKTIKDCSYTIEYRCDLEPKRRCCTQNCDSQKCNKKCRIIQNKYIHDCEGLCGEDYPPCV